MVWTTITFGKHKGKTLPQVIFDDADWFFYAYEQGYFKNGLAQEAREVYRRARSIRIPEQDGQKMLVEYVIHKPNGKFGTMGLIPVGFQPGHYNVSSVIDFYKPRSLVPYDKTGYKHFVLALKAIMFGNHSHRLSKQDREDFFSDDANFVLN